MRKKKSKTKKAGFVKCAKCKKILHGIPKVYKLRKLPYSKKKVERVYGGHLCSKCTREIIKYNIRKMFSIDK